MAKPAKKRTATAARSSRTDPTLSTRRNGDAAPPAVAPLPPAPVPWVACGGCRLSSWCARLPRWPDENQQHARGERGGAHSEERWRASRWRARGRRRPRRERRQSRCPTNKSRSRSRARPAGTLPIWQCAAGPEKACEKPRKARAPSSCPKVRDAACAAVATAQPRAERSDARVVVDRNQPAGPSTRRTREKAV